MLTKVNLKMKSMKQIYPLLMLVSACAVGCGSTKVVVDEEGIQAQIARVELQEQANREQESSPTKQHGGRPTDAYPDADPDADGSF